MINHESTHLNTNVKQQIEPSEEISGPFIRDVAHRSALTVEVFMYAHSCIYNTIWNIQTHHLLHSETLYQVIDEGRVRGVMISS